ncbi:hypothetical protein CR513_29028, partial [Mucuna pruriens]
MLTTLYHGQLYQQRAKKHRRIIEEMDTKLGGAICGKGNILKDLTNMDGRDLAYLVNLNAIKKFYP